MPTQLCFADTWLELTVSVQLLSVFADGHDGQQSAVRVAQLIEHEGMPACDGG